MAKTNVKVVKCTLDVTTQSAFAAGVLPAGTYTFNETESLPKGAFITAVKTNALTNPADGTSIAVAVGSQALVAAVVTANWTGARTPSIAGDPDAITVSATGDLKFTTVGEFSAGKVEVFVEYIY